MRSRSSKIRTLALAVVAAALTCAAFAPPALSKVPVTFKRIAGFPSKGTPAKYNKVGILKVGPKKARNVLVLNPGTSASAAYFAPLAKDVVTRAKGWQVWAVERRENLLEDHSVLNRAKEGKATPQKLFDYYLGFITDSSITDHFKFIPDADVGYARKWGMRTEIEDLNRVVRPRRGSAARWQWEATRWAAPSRPPTRPGTSTASLARRVSPDSCSSTAAAAPRRSAPTRPHSA